MRLRLQQGRDGKIYANFVMNDERVETIGDCGSAIADFLKEKSPPILMDRDAEIEWLGKFISYLLKKFRISNFEFLQILRMILEGQ